MKRFACPTPRRENQRQQLSGTTMPSWTTCYSRRFAARKTKHYYVLAIINSNELAAAAEKRSWQEGYTAQDTSKAGLEATHSTLRRQRHATRPSQRTGPKLPSKNARPSSPTATSRPSRPATPSPEQPARCCGHEWQPNSKTAQDIEAAVAELLSDPAQAALAERQMTVG